MLEIELLLRLFHLRLISLSSQTLTNVTSFVGKRGRGMDTAVFSFSWMVQLTKIAFVPKYDRTSWFDRKSNYSMQALVTCDANLRVIHLVFGRPGSTHDARVLKSADYMNNDNSIDYFTGEQHGLGHAAFGLHLRVVPNNKEPLASIPDKLRIQFATFFSVGKV